MSPALSDLPIRKITRVIESLGFVYVRTKGSHAVYRHADGRAVVIPQHGTVKRGTLASILRQAGITPAEFLELLQRRSSRDQFAEPAGRKLCIGRSDFQPRTLRARRSAAGRVSIVFVSPCT